MDLNCKDYKDENEMDRMCREWVNEMHWMREGRRSEITSWGRHCMGERATKCSVKY